MESVDGIEQCSPCIPFSPPLRAASECEIVGASVAIRIANNPSQQPIFRWKRLKMRPATRLEAVADYAMTHRASRPARRRLCRTCLLAPRAHPLRRCSGKTHSPLDGPAATRGQ